MKLFKHLKLGGYRVSRQALRHYSLYRRASIGNLPYGLKELTDFHIYESSGKLPDGIEKFTAFSHTNAYANGKWIMRLTQDAITEDILKGDFCKAEFMNSCDLDKLYTFGPPECNFKFTYKHKFKYTANGWFTGKLVRSMTNKPDTLFAYESNESGR